MEHNRSLHNFVGVLRSKHFLPALSLALYWLNPIGVPGFGLVDTEYFRILFSFETSQDGSIVVEMRHNERRCRCFAYTFTHFVMDKQKVKTLVPCLGLGSCDILVLQVETLRSWDSNTLPPTTSDESSFLETTFWSACYPQDCVWLLLVCFMSACYPQRVPTNRHRVPTNRHRLPTNRHRRAYWTLRVVIVFYYGTSCCKGTVRLLSGRPASGDGRAAWN